MQENIEVTFQENIEVTFPRSESFCEICAWQLGEEWEMENPLWD